jgi:hypothetical protein
MLEVTSPSCHEVSKPPTPGRKWKRTIAIGNCSSTNRDIAGKMISEVRGLEEIRAAIAKEQNPTNTTVY